MKKLTLLLALTMILFSCKPEAEKPTVTTKSVGEVTETSAKVVGQVTEDGGAEVTERGVCWSTTAAPEVIDYRTVDGTGIGTFNSNISDLVPNTQYYVRAYATNEKGVSYGEELTFTTKKEIELPEVKTAEVEDITESEAVSGGEVISDGGAEVTARGICWSTKQNPTIEDDKTEDGSGVGTFASEMTDLEADTKYYVRAYATNEKGTAYGEEVSFTTEEVEEPEDPENPEQPEDPENPEQPEDPETPEQPEDPENPEQPEDPENPEQPEDPENPEQPEDPENPEQPEDPETPEQPEAPENPEQPVGPVVKTAEVTEITANTAVCGGEVVSGGDAIVIARGICWNTTGAPTVSDTYTIDGNGMGVYTSYMTDLQLGTTYYVRAYATDVKGVTSYGEEVSFTTLERNANGHTYVDLGLPSGLLWATCNVGANAPEEYGDYFAWGETTTKETYDYDNCPTYGLSTSELQYIDSEGNLTAQYDAATANWGGTWRMPTYAEFNELRNNCTWTWTTQNGVNGYNVEGPSGNSIFLPSAGYRDGSSLIYAGSLGYYWSSTPSEYGYYSAYYLDFYISYRSMNCNGRYYGRAVRPILE